MALNMKRMQTYPTTTISLSSSPLRMFSVTIRPWRTVCAAISVLNRDIADLNLDRRNLQREVLLKNLGRDKRSSRLDSAVFETGKGIFEGHSHVKVGH